MSGSFEQLAAPPVFVVGHHRSGTTWVFDLLTYPGSVAGIFESWMFTRDLGFGSLLHWGHWGERQVERVEKLTGTRAGLIQLVSRDEVFAQCKELAVRWMSNALTPDSRYIVEKTPDHLYAMDLIAEVFPGAKFINVIRDGRDVAVSVRAAHSWNPTWMPSGMTSVYHVGKRWRSAIEFGDAAAQRLGENYREVRYEDLRANPHHELAELFSFCGIVADQATIDAAVDANDFEKNFAGGEDQFRRRGQVGEWIDRLGVLDRFLLALGSRGSLIRHGYAKTRWWWLGKRPVDVEPRARATSSTA